MKSLNFVVPGFSIYLENKNVGLEPPKSFLDLIINNSNFSMHKKYFIQWQAKAQTETERNVKDKHVQSCYFADEDTGPR